MGALLKKEYKVENHNQGPSNPRPSRSKDSGESESLGALILHSNSPLAVQPVS